MSFSKKGQNWSIEAMISIAIFVVVVIVSLILINYIPSSDSKELADSSEKILISVENDLGLVKNYEVVKSTLDDYEGKTSSELAEELGVDGDVCITFQTLNGTIITLPNSKNGIGVGNDTVCGN